ncbi:MAG TPA: MFS transporter, partial [Dehalococcoidia bacterium]|nr:MFS transporter [Dehalococcoidia bacterium]
LPLLLQAEMGMSPLESGLTTFPQAIGVVTMIQVAGRIYPRMGPRRMMMIGMAGATLTTIAFVFVTLDTDPWWIRLIMYLRGASFSMVLVSLQTATFATISPRDMGRASALYNSGRQVAASFGVAILASVLENRLAHQGTRLGPPPVGNPDLALTAFQEAFAVAAALTVLGIFASLLVSDKDAAPSMRRAPTPIEVEEAAAVPGS